MGNVSAIFVLWLAYLGLTSSVAPPNLVLGLLVAIVAWRLAPTHPRPPGGRRLGRAVPALIRYALVLVSDMVVGGTQVARIVLAPRLRVRPGIIAIPSGCRSELATALSAHAITLAPGEIVVEIDASGTLHTHCLDVSRSERYTEEAQRLRRDLLSRIVPEEPVPADETAGPEPPVPLEGGTQ